MIDHTIHFLTTYLNKELQLLYGIDEDKAVMGNLVDQDGVSATEVMNKVVVSLISMEQVTNAATPKGGRKALSMGGIAKSSEPVLMNLYIMFSSNYESKHYHESLKMLSSVLGIFQTTSSFPQISFPDMHPSLEKLNLEIVNLSLQDQLGIWNSLGAKYVPSVLYKLRLVSVDLERIDSILPEIAALASKARKKNK